MKMCKTLKAAGKKKMGRRSWVSLKTGKRKRKGRGGKEYGREGVEELPPYSKHRSKERKKDMNKIEVRVRNLVTKAEREKDCGGY